MCSREEVKLEVEAGERRMEAKLERSHQAIAQTISTVGADMKALRTKLETHMDNEDENYRKMTREVTDKLDKYIEADIKWKVGVDGYMTEMLPVKDGVHAIQTLNKFAKWAGLPAIGAAVAYWFVK